MDGQDGRRAHVVAIREAGERATRLTKQLLVLSRRSLARPRAIELNAWLENLNARLCELVGPAVTIAFGLSHQPLLIQADPAQLEHSGKPDSQAAHRAGLCRGASCNCVPIKCESVITMATCRPGLPQANTRRSLSPIPAAELRRRT